MADKYWSRIAEPTGLEHCPKQNPFGQSEGSVMGARKGFIVAVGSAVVGSGPSVKVMVRFPENPVESTRMALENSSTLAAALETDKVGDKQLKNAMIGPCGVVWHFDSSVGRPEPERVAAMANALVDALKGTIPDFQGKCEECRSASVNEILLMNGTPVYYCAGCRFKVQSDADQAARNYQPSEPNLFLGILYGGAAAVLGAAAWGSVAFYGIGGRPHFSSAMFLGFLVGWAMQKGAGSIGLLGEVAMGVLTVLSVVMGDVLFYTLSVTRSENVAFSTELAGRIVANLWTIATKSGGGILPLIFALLGMGFGAYFALVAQSHSPEKVEFTRLAP